ncbi:hypothetical protein FNF28_04564 [Cafeteria roenbergensis]|uniref:Uncharacterized protein n=1 Tax=Cafeteria roenbergensis TaxID=33653 RepID=A0A5A8DBK6_CAFRO|nr:hypothetical protein FNF28_04564 [Cafeteria roenbergensis]
MESLSLPDRLALRLLEALLPSNPWEESTPPRCERHAAPSEAAERFEQLRSLVRAVTPTKPNSVTTVTVPVTCGPAVRRSSFRLPGASAAPAMDRGQMGPQAPGARGLAAEALAAGARERELSGIALWRVPGLKADDSAVRALFRDSLRVPAFVAAGIISCAASVSESDEACRHQAVQLAEEAWFQASGLPHSPEARERAYAAVTMLLRLLSPVRLGDELCIRAGIDPSLVLAAFDDDAARRIVSGLSLDAAAAAGSMLSDPDVADPYSFASMILPAAATTVRAVATARLADALGCGMAEAHVTPSDTVAAVAASARRSGEIILGMVERAVARWPFRRRVSLLQLLRVVTPELIAGSVSARRRYCDFVLGGVASALGGDFERGLAVRELQASNLGVALQACATGHLSRVQPFAVELFTPVQQRFLAASQHGVVGRADDSRDGVAAGAAADARGGRAAGGGGGAASAAAAAATAGAGSDPEQVGGALLQEAIPPALRRAAIACLLDTQTFPLRARDGRPLVDPALARMLGEAEDLLCVPAREGRVTAWQLLCAIDAPVPRIIRMAVRALCGEVWFRERFRGAPFEQILAATKEEDHSPAASSSATTKVRTPPPQSAAGGGGTPRAGGITPPATAGGFGLAASPRGGGADSGSGSGSGTRSSAEGFADDDDDALSVASASDAAIAARNAAQAPVAFSFRATSLLALRLVNGAVRELGSGVPGLLTFADWVNLECANGYLGHLALDWLWCGALAGHAGASFIDRAAVRAAAEERVWDALRLQSPPQAPANVVAEGSAARIIDAAFGWNDGGAELDTVERHVSPDAESVEYLASPMASGSIEHVGGRTMAVRGHRALVTMRGVQRGLGAVPAHSVFMDGFISPVTKKEAGGSTVTSKQLRRLVSNGVLLTQTSDRTALLTPSSDRTDRSSGDRVMPLRAEARREWLRLHAAARQDVQRILVSVGDLFRPRALVAAEAGDGAVDIVVNTANRAWPSGGVLPLLVDRVQQGMASD